MSLLAIFHLRRRHEELFSGHLIHRVGPLAAVSVVGTLRTAGYDSTGDTVINWNTVIFFMVYLLFAVVFAVLPLFARRDPGSGYLHGFVTDLLVLRQPWAGTLDRMTPYLGLLAIAVGTVGGILLYDVTVAVDRLVE